MSRFLIWCTGARNDYVEPGMEHHRYVTMGLSLLVTALLAAGSMMVLTGYLIEEAPLWARIAVSVFWAFVVFTIDRTVAVTLVDGQGFLMQLAMFLPRILLAVAAAYLVSEPLVLRAFEQEIDEQIRRDTEALRESFRIEIDMRPDIVDRQAAIRVPVTDVQNRIAALEEQAAQYEEAADREESGEGETGEESMALR